MIKYLILVVLIFSINFIKCDESTVVETNSRLEEIIDDVFKGNSNFSDDRAVLENEYIECPEDHCVPYHMCSANNTIIRDGAGILDTRYIRQLIINFQI